MLNNAKAIGEIVVRNSVVKVEGQLISFKKFSPGTGCYEGVQLFKYKRKWFLYYPKLNSLCTGAFKTKKQATNWFNCKGK